VTGGLAQTVVTGTVSDRYGPTIGVSVIEQGTSTGTVTDINGVFSIKVSNPDKAVLVFKYIGMNDAREPLNGRVSGITINMTESANQLDDVVVIGYGTMKRSNLTGAVASVSGKTLEQVPTPSVAEALVGKLPGVQITSMDGSPDAEITIRVRGGGSITEDNSPLILVDGFEVSNLNDISPTDVESVEILKDAASTAIYGSRGANGVLLVTTKRPVEGRISVNVNAYMQVKTLAKSLDVMDPYEYVSMLYESIYTKGASARKGVTDKYGQPWEFYIYQGDEGNDWQDEIFGSNPIAQFYDVNINGGTQKTKYKFSFMHQDQPGVMDGNGMRQTNLNLNINTKISDNLIFDFRTRFVNKVVNGSGTDGVSILSALQTAPTWGLDDYMELPEDNGYYDPDLMEEQVRYDPRRETERNYRKRNTRTFYTMGGLTWNPIKNLSFHTEFGYEYRFGEDRKFWGLETKEANNNNKQPVAQLENSKRTNWQWTNTASYSFKLKEDHAISALLGHEMKNIDNYYSRNKYRYFPESIKSSDVFNNLSLGTAYEPTSKKDTPDKTLSFFGRINYSYKDKYLADFTTRADGSTKFAKGNRWGFFPAASVAWRISEEDFMVNNKTISNLKLRFGYGLAGNNRIGSDLYAQYYEVSRDRPAGWGEEERYYYNFFKNGSTYYLYNPDIKWETTTTRNLGLDFGFFRERINGTIDVYWNTTKDLLVPSDIPGHTGFTKVMTNVGQTSNKGIELALNGYIIQKKDFTLNANFNIGYNKNKIDKLASGENEWILSSGWASTQLLNTDDYRAYVGRQKGLIYGYVNDGFYTLDDFKGYNSGTGQWELKDGKVNSYNVSGTPKPGIAKFKKLTEVDPNNPDSYYITDEDRQVIGNTNPKFSGGFGVNATYKGFDVTLFFNYMYGFDVYNANKVQLTSTWNKNQNNWGMEVAMDKRWRYVDNMGNYIGNDAQAMAELNKNATIWSPLSFGRPVAMSYGVEDGSFLRLNTASIGYTLPERITNKYGIRRLRLYATGYNLFTITGYSGYDPEVNIDKGLTPAIDNNSYPRSRTYTFGMQLSF